MMIPVFVVAGRNVELNNYISNYSCFLSNIIFYGLRALLKGSPQW